MSQAIVIAEHYRLDDYLGSSLLSRVYRAWDIAQERVVALRLLAPFLEEEKGLLERFFEEVERVRRLGQAHILPIYDIGREGPIPWLVMEFIPQGSLRERLWSHLPLPVDLELMRQISQLLSQLHAQGILHGDIKPSNIFVRNDGQVLLGDFGMALLRQGVNPLLRGSLTTPRPYPLSPEQARGLKGDIRSDIFSLGILLYQLVTPPSSWNQLSSFPPRHPSQSNHSLPQTIDQVVFKAIATQPQERYQQVTDMMQALETAVGEVVIKEASPQQLAEALTAATPPSLPTPATSRIEMPSWLAAEDLVEREQRRAKRHRRLRYMLIAALALLVLATLSSEVPFYPPQPTSALTSTSPPGEWAMFQHDLARSGYLPGDSPPFKGKLKWKFTTTPPQPLFSAPAIHQGTVYLFTGGPKMVALDATTGIERWQFQTSGPVNSSPALANGLLFVGYRDGRVVAIDTVTRKQAWEFATGNYVYSSPVVWQGIVFIGSADGKLYALDALQGNLIWDFPTQDRIISSPAMGNNVVGVGSADGKVYVVDAFSGKKRIGYIAGLSVDSSPAIDGDVLYIGATQFLRALNTQAKESRYEKSLLKWWTQLHLQGLAPPAPTQSGFLWSTTLSGVVVSSPAIAGDLIFAGTTKGFLYAVDKSSGEVKWKFNAQSPILAAPTVAGNTLLFSDWDGRLHALNSQTGKELWAYTTQGKLLTPPVVAQGLIYVAATDGALYVIE